ncbi:MAG TPA: aminopeptidase P N-terminal domain-containing protein [Blastocatellia bacterium]|nr:aminopeptidase P N-terminal domain-containing protein [Blastocatellia bacterium]
MSVNCRRIRFSAVSAALAVALILPMGSVPRAVASGSTDNPIATARGTEPVAATAAAPEIWRIAPSAPKISEADRLAELRARRQEVMNRMGDKAIMVLFSAEPRVYTNDVDYHYRQENDLYYLTGLKQEGATLILIPGAARTQEILLMPERNPGRETWTGHMMSADEARARSGIQEVWDSELLNGFLAFLAPRAEQAIAKRGSISKPNAQLAGQWQNEFRTLMEAAKSDQAEIYLLAPSNNRDLREYRQEYEFAEAIKAASPGLKTKSAFPIFAELRQIKSSWEQKLLQHAVDISVEAFHRVFAVAAPAMYEYEIQAEYEYTFRRRNADNWGYPCIVGAGTNATTLHYITSQDRLDDGDLLLTDCAAEYDHYSGDITRTIPISGKYTREQAEIYNIVFDAQTEAIKLARPGNFMLGNDPKNSVHGRSAQVIKEGLLRLGLITSKDNNEFRTWFMHGASHWLGMNVHDVGVPGKALAPGMILTVEPGIYIRPDALDGLPKTPENERFIKAVRPAFEKYKGIGVRIEDDILVTSGEPLIMSGAIPRKLEDVETAMARLKQELRKSGWPSVASR